jgi:hypothetical protein
MGKQGNVSVQDFMTKEMNQQKGIGSMKRAPLMIKKEVPTQ